MQITKIAKIYADALMGLNEKKVLEELELVQKTFTDSKELKNVMVSPAISSEQKIGIIKEVFEKHLCKEIMNFLYLLAEKKHYNEFDVIIEKLKENINNKNNIKKITVTSAVELDNTYKEKITKAISTKLNKEINANWLINEDIIAGLIIKIDDDIIDTSIRTKLDKIKGSI